MSEEEVVVASESTEQPDEVEPVKKKSIVKLLLMIGIPLLLLGGGAAVLFLTPWGAKILHKDTTKKEVAPHDLVFFSLPELLVNLNNLDKKKSTFLRLVVQLEVANAEASKTLELLKPRIIDQFQIYLRELRPEDVQGSAGIQRLREELLKRVNAVSSPIKVNDVLFQTMLVQ